MSLILSTILISGCSGERPTNLGVDQNRLMNCPQTPNCISSEAGDEDHRIEPFQLKIISAKSWEQVSEVVSTLPRSTVVTSTDTYMHVECKSRIFRFVDDLELYLNMNSGRISIRSASRLGKSDLGVNRKRAEWLRNKLGTSELIQ